MLQTLSIKNVALIKSLTLDFEDGFNVLLGETGAGKSIIFDALNFVLGGKADKTLIRSGEQFMKVDAVFVSAAKAKAGLEQLGLDCPDDEIVLSRTFSQDGKNKIRLNGEPIASVTLKKVGALLVDSYSQLESVELLQNKNHLALIDRFGGQTLRELKKEVKERYDRYVQTLKEIEALGGDEAERERTKSLLEYQIREIEEADLQPGEQEELQSQLSMMQNAEKIAEAVKTCTDVLQDSPSAAIEAVQKAESCLQGLCDVDDINSLLQRLTSCKYELQDISETLSNMERNLDFSEKRLEQLDQRNDLIKSLLKKYGSTIEQVLQYKQDAQSRFDKLQDAEAELAKLEVLRDQQQKYLLQACESLTSRRKEVAHIVEEKVVKELAELNMKNTTFVVEFKKLDGFTANGNDEVSFTFSANKGQEVKALAKTASGGEMSRFMLAIKNIFAEFGTAQTLVFDEIDAGISGETGVVVGEKIAKLSKSSQVICITHLPQVACQGDNFFYVSKSVEDGNTVTQVKNLEQDQIVYELARMVGGDNVTEKALEHSKELRQRAMQGRE